MKKEVYWTMSIFAFTLLLIIYAQSKTEVPLYKGDHSKGEIEILEEVVAYQNKYATLYNDHVLFPSKKKGNYLRFVWSGPAGSVILPITKDGKVVLLKNFRHALREWAIEIPRGHGESGENGEETAKRELMEETGIKANKIIYLGIVTPDSGILSSKVDLFLALDCEFVQKDQKEESEAIECLITKSSEEVYQMAMDGKIQDGCTLMALFRAQKYIKK